jgi:hypothetical protein
MRDDRVSLKSSYGQLARCPKAAHSRTPRIAAMLGPGPAPLALGVTVDEINVGLCRILHVSLAGTPMRRREGCRSQSRHPGDIPDGSGTPRGPVPAPLPGLGVGVLPGGAFVADTLPAWADRLLADVAGDGHEDGLYPAALPDGTLAAAVDGEAGESSNGPLGDSALTDQSGTACFHGSSGAETTAPIWRRAPSRSAVPHHSTILPFWKRAKWKASKSTSLPVAAMPRKVPLCVPR